MTGHSILSPSSAHRWLECPASAKINAAAREQLGDQPSPAAEDGRRAHTFAERWLKSGQSYTSPPADVLAEITAVNDPDLLPSVATYVETVQAISLKGELLGVEQWVPIFILPAHGGKAQGGTIDALAYDAEMKTLWVVDFKYGRELVEAVDPFTGAPNKQLALYAAGALAQTTLMVERIGLCIVQPRAFAAEAVRWHVMSVADLLAMLPELRRGAETAMSADLSNRNAGKWCKYCALDGQCPVQQTLAMQVTQSLFTDISADTKPITTMDADQLAWVLRNKAAVVKFFEAAEQVALMRAQAGEVIPGWEIGSSKPRTVWNSEHPVVKAVTDSDMGHISHNFIPPFNPSNKFLALLNILDRHGSILKLAFKNLSDKAVNSSRHDLQAEGLLTQTEPEPKMVPAKHLSQQQKEILPQIRPKTVPAKSLPQHP